MQLVFVYGTLRKGEINHHLLRNSEYLGIFETEPSYQLFNIGSYPGVIEGSTRVFGEIYRVDDSILEQLDILENIPFDYVRKPLETPYGSAWIYLFQDESKLDETIVSGNWLYRDR